MTYGLDTENIWVKAEGYFSKIAWKHISIWRERNGLLVLQFYGKLPFYYRIEDLKQLGIYSNVMEKVQKYAKSYDK